MEHSFNTINRDKRHNLSVRTYPALIFSSINRTKNKCWIKFAHILDIEDVKGELILT